MHCNHCHCHCGGNAANMGFQIARIWDAIYEMRLIMSDVVDDQIVRGAQLVGLIKAEFASVHEQLDAALANNGAAVDSAVAQKATADAERIKGLLDELATVLPADVPEVPVPDPGQPAELPADSGSDQPPAADVPAEVPASSDGDMAPGQVS